MHWDVPWEETVCKIAEAVHLSGYSSYRHLWELQPYLPTLFDFSETVPILNVRELPKE